MGPGCRNPSITEEEFLEIRKKMYNEADDSDDSDETVSEKDTPIKSTRRSKRKSVQKKLAFTRRQNKKRRGK